MKVNTLRAAVAAFLGAGLLGVLFVAGVFVDDDLDDLEPDLPAGRTSAQISELIANIDEVIETTAFYSAFTVLLVLLVVWAFAQRKVAWAIYSGTALAVLWWFAFLEQNLSGIFWTPLQFSMPVLIVAGFGLAAANAGIAACLVPPDGRFRTLKHAHLCLAAIFLGIGVCAGLGLIGASLTLSAACIAISFLQHFLPLERVKTLFGRLRESRGMMIFALLPILWFGPLLSEIDEQFDIVFLNRILAGLLTTTFITIYLARAVVVLRDRDAALEKMVEDAQREAKLNQALLEAERGFVQARDLAQERSKRLAVASHDMRQPIMALRATMEATMRTDDEGAKRQMNAAFDYLDGLAGTFIQEGRADGAAPTPQDERLDTSPHVSSEVLSETIERMFRKEAEAKGLQFTVSNDASVVSGDPLKLMRVLSNLMSNAVKHTPSGFVSLDGKQHAHEYRFSISNSADLDDNSDLFEPYSKGAASKGSGLGLSIVQEVVEQEGLSLDIIREPKGQTTIIVGIPTADTTP